MINNLQLCPFSMEKGLHKFLLAMKISFFLTLLATLNVSASIYSQSLSFDIDVSNKTVREVFKQIENESNYRFFYNEDFKDLSKVVTLNMKHQDINTVLDRLLQNTHVSYRILDKNVIVITPYQRIITGKVTDASSGDPIPGVNIIVEGTTQGTISDVDGHYSIEVENSDVVLVFSYVGYKNQRVPVGVQNVIDVSLSEEAGVLQEVVVIGYGEREKKDLTGAISSMQSKDIEQSVSMSPEAAMQGKMAGVYVSTPSGIPSARPTVRIRGVSTFGVADPLYVIDGVPVTEFGSGAESSEAVVRDIRGSINVLSLINPDDIESISVLKDASAAAIYGVRAANGVVLITTKKGKTGRAKVDFSYNYGIQNIPKTYKVLNTAQYTTEMVESYKNNPNQTANMPSVFDSSSPDYLGNKPTFDWQKPFLYENAPIMDASARIYGGSEKTTYYVSAGYGYTQAPYIGNNLERYSLATNLTTKVANWVEAGITYHLAYVDALDQQSAANNYTLGTVLSAPPWQPLYLKDDYMRINSPVEDRYGYATSVDSTNDFSTDPPSVNYTKKYGVETAENSLAAYDRRINEARYFLIRNLGNAYIALEPIKGLKIKGSIDLDWYYNNRNSWSSVDGNMFSSTPNNPFAVGNGSSFGSLGGRYSQNFNMVKELTISYIKSFGDHNINVTLDAMDQKYTYVMNGASTQQVDIDDPKKRFLAGPDEYTNVQQFRNQNALQGYMARVSYNYASRYYVDLTVRRDGTSRFAPGYRWGTFPSVALAWRLTDENFMQGIDFLNDLKIRAGWGQLGNQETRSFAYLSGVSDAPTYSWGITPNGVGNFVYGYSLPDFPTLDLTWETATTSNIGFDAVMLHNKLTFTAEYYNRLTEDILQGINLPASVGIENSVILNLASVRNNGVEFQVGYNDRIGDFEYNVSANLTTVHNNVVKIYRGQPFSNALNDNERIEEGYPINYIWGFKTGGIFQTQQEVLNWQTKYKDAQADSALVSAGDMYFQDVHGAPTETEKFYSKSPDGKVDLNDRTYIGKTIPGYYYGITLGGAWKNFDLSIFFQGVGDVQKYNTEMARGLQMSSQGNNSWDAVLNRWTPSHQNAWDKDDPLHSLPRAVYADPAGNNRYSDRFVQNAGFLRLKNLMVGYTVPQNIATKLKYFERLRVYISGSNMFTLTQWDGLDPEVDNDGLPTPRTWTFGVNATF